MGSYIPSTGEERQAMLQAIGLTSADQLFDIVPEAVRVKNLDLPEGLSELEVSQRMAALAGKNRVFSSVFRGAGAYRHYIPSIVKTVTSKEEFLTAYTPYQAEISQGVLQSIFEYQTHDVRADRHGRVQRLRLRRGRGRRRGRVHVPGEKAPHRGGLRRCRPPDPGRHPDLLLRAGTCRLSSCPPKGMPPTPMP